MHIRTLVNPLLGMLLAMVMTLFITDQLQAPTYPIGWMYLALFLLTAGYAFIASGIYRWVAVVWLGSVLAVVYRGIAIPGEQWLIVAVLAIQYLTATMGGGVMGQLLHYHLAMRRQWRSPRIPSSHSLLLTLLVLLLLPVISFFLHLSSTVSSPGLLDILMFVPGNTPFLYPVLLVVITTGHWLYQHREITLTDRKLTQWALVLAYGLLALTLLIKLVFGWWVANTGIS